MEKDAARENERPVIGITIGDINGIGPEVIIKSLADSRILNYLTPVIYGSTKALSFYKKAFEINEFNYSQSRNPGQFMEGRINVVNCWNEQLEIKPGVDAPEGGKAAFLALERAVNDYREGYILALVTAPINKNNIQRDDFHFPGHTEYLAEKFNADGHLMMMVGETMRIGVVTGHVPLKDVPAKITRELLASKIAIMMNSLKEDFGITKPRIAVLGFNPHAGENGLLGGEEKETIIPVIEDLKKKGSLVFGPFPADGFFGSGDYTRFDGVMAMYHDQGLIPFKTLAFDRGVNFTAGLSAIRTSPDHGVAYNIAGKGTANPESMREAIYLAIDVWARRKDMKTYAR